MLWWCVTLYLDNGKKEKIPTVSDGYIESKKYSLAPLSGLDDLAIHLFLLDPEKEAFVI